MERARVVITGLGTVSPLGNTVSAAWEGLLAGRSGIARIEQFDPANLASQIAGEVRNFTVEEWVNPRDAAYMDRTIPFASAAAKMALEDSGLLEATGAEKTTGVYMGTAMGGIGWILRQHSSFVSHGPRRVSPLTIPFGIPDMTSGYISIAHGLQGPNQSVASACASGATAIGEAFHAIANGRATAMLAGGVEALDPLMVAAFCSARVLSLRNADPQAASRPFDRLRDGFVIAEGSAVLVLEALENARARGARIYAEIAGYGASSDAFHITKPRPDGNGAIRAMELALADAELPAERIGYINAHGTSTADGDRHETEAIKTLFGERAKQVPISSTKSMSGHMLGAAGAFEALVCALAVREGVVPPTINLQEEDPRCDLDYVPNTAREARMEAALSNSFGFGGHNVALVVRRFS